jgi:hypothetical protein
MPKQAWAQGLAAQRGQGTLFNTYTTAKTRHQSGSPVSHRSERAWRSAIRSMCRVKGGISNIVTTPGTITFQIMFGSIVVWSSGAIQLNATAHTTLPFSLEVDLVVQLLNTTVGGAIAKMMGIGVLTGVMFTKTAGQTDGANSESVITVPVTAPALGAAFDSTIGQTMDFWAGFSISNAGQRDPGRDLQSRREQLSTDGND